ncbi:hypothetical protein GA830_19175 (plasmid) [Mesorhizobium sp. NBSH29]|uniref:hypothetical protein n=1 Tax=Mesorhizobium sp. NBSH29 TaxID=2654249 RepID=UPI0018964DAD|nr:hypothetical protein [Mesorhizobium sp. NBSH29]QPC88961.1 hypothetical protein GA830_19175 [Mesorhizobium sp. NBSH29]
MAAPELPPKTLRGQGLDRWIWRIAKIEGGLMPDNATLDEHGIKPSTLVKFWGGTRTVTQYFHITTDTLVPFFLAIAIQTAANPDALRHIHRDCLVPHPLDRISRHRRLDQSPHRRPSPEGAAPFLRPAPALCRAEPDSTRCWPLTAPIVATAPPGEQDRLFPDAQRPQGARSPVYLEAAQELSNILS